MNEETCFRPLTGIVILNSLIAIQILIPTFWSFRPLTRIVILNANLGGSECLKCTVFPSLYGDYDF